jgi:hypothetical protein
MVLHTMVAPESVGLCDHTLNLLTQGRHPLLVEAQKIAQAEIAGRAGLNRVPPLQAPILSGQAVSRRSRGSNHGASNELLRRRCRMCVCLQRGVGLNAIWEGNRSFLRSSRSLRRSATGQTGERFGGCLFCRLASSGGAWGNLALLPFTRPFCLLSVRLGDPVHLGLTGSAWWTRKRS